MPTGFTVSPVKAPGPGPIGITNLGHESVTYSLTPVATSMQGKLCAPTATPVTWFHVADSVTVPAGKTVSEPVTVSGSHSTTDVAVKVQPAGSEHGVGVSYVAFAQEIIGQVGTAAGCTSIKGYTPPKTSTAAAPASSGSGLPVAAIGGGVLGLVVLGAALKATVFRGHKGSRGVKRADALAPDLTVQMPKVPASNRALYIWFDNKAWHEETVDVLAGPNAQGEYYVRSVSRGDEFAVAGSALRRAK